MTDGFIPPHGGYDILVTYQKALIIFDATSYLVRRWVRIGSRTRDQMEQGARSGKQNIVEGSLAAATSTQTEIHLTNVARAGLGELLEDYKDFLRLRKLQMWDKYDSRALEIRSLARPHEPATYEVYRPFIESENPEVVRNTMLCLINQTCYLLDQQIRRQEQEFLKHGGIRERMTKARLEARAAQEASSVAAEPPECPLCGKPMRRRTAKTGAHAGEPFWGCSGYPDCRGIRRFEDDGTNGINGENGGP
jgi:four helix bundle suffix protein